MGKGFKFNETAMANVYEILPFESADKRGCLTKFYSSEIFNEFGVKFYPSESLLIKSRKYVLRGLHYQREKEISKLITCISGHLFSVILNMNSEEPEFGKWKSVELKEGSQLYVPCGYAFGTFALQDSIMICQCSEKTYAQFDEGVKWDDPDLNIKWPIDVTVCNPIISEKDNNLQRFKDYVNKRKCCLTKGALT